MIRQLSPHAAIVYDKSEAEDINNEEDKLEENLENLKRLFI
jgi:hypothetical protein